MCLNFACAVGFLFEGRADVPTPRVGGLSRTLSEEAKVDFMRNAVQHDAIASTSTVDDEVKEMFVWLAKCTCSCE